MNNRVANVVRAWFDRQALAQPMRLGTEHQILLTQASGVLAHGQP